MYDETAEQQRQRNRILARADKKYGGQTSSWRVTQQIKMLAQRYNVGHHITLSSATGKNLQVVMGDKLERCLGNGQHYQFLMDLIDTVQDCGYNAAVGNNFMEIVKV